MSNRILIVVLAMCLFLSASRRANAEFTCDACEDGPGNCSFSVSIATQSSQVVCVGTTLTFCAGVHDVDWCNDPEERVEPCFTAQWTMNGVAQGDPVSCCCPSEDCCAYGFWCTCLEHTFDTPGVYLVKLLARDPNEGEEGYVYQASDAPVCEGWDGCDTVEVIVAQVDIDTDSDNDGDIDGTEDPIEEDAPGKCVAYNSDDDNDNTIQDRDETGTVTGEDDLARVNLSYDCGDCTLDGYKIVLEKSSDTSDPEDSIKVWASATKGTEIGLSQTYFIGTDDIPTTVYVEGYNTGVAMLDMVLKKPDDTEICRDKVKFTVGVAPTFSNIFAVAPAAKCGEQVTIHFTASETLSENPTVTVNGNSASYSSKSGNDYTYTYTIGQYEPTGEATIHITGYDLDNIFGEETDTRALWIVKCTTGDDGALGEFTYDKNGRRKTMWDSRGLTTYSYDVMGRLVKVVDPDGRWIEYEYDAAGNRTKMTTHSDSPSFEHETEYSYYDNGLLHEVTDQLDGVTEYTYKDNGLVDTITYPNGTKAVHSYNSRNWLTCISNRKSDETVIAQFDYTYDPPWGDNGTRTRVVENILKPDSNQINAQVDYEYDDLYRLVHEHRIADPGVQNADPGVAYEYNFTYDDAGNRTQWEIVGGATTNYTYDDANKMASPGTFTYDDKGNTLTHVVGGVTTTYTWDLLNRMTQWQKTGQTTQTYVYDADGMRVRLTPSGGMATDFLLDAMEIAEEMTGASVVSNIGPRNRPIITISASGRTIYAADALGSTRAITDGSQVVAEAGMYDAYGRLLADYPTSSAPRYGFAGTHHYYQDSTGLQYLKHRYYNPATGRFITADPIRYGSSHYAYAGNRPTVMVDPLGLYLVGTAGCIIGGGVGVIGGIVGGGGFGETLCRGALSCGVGILAEIACESSGGLLCSCAVGAGAGAAGAGIDWLCTRRRCPPQPFDAKCALYGIGIGFVSGCVGAGVAGEAIEDIVMKVLLELGGMVGGSACSNDIPVAWPPEPGY